MPADGSFSVQKLKVLGINKNLSSKPKVQASKGKHKI
jgi:hypothetical protein